MVYAVPLVDGSFGVAQAGESMMTNVIYVALFSYRLAALPERVPTLAESAAVALTATWRQALNRGEWFAICEAKQVFAKKQFPNERYASSGYVGAKHQDAGLLSDFLSAFHGLLPWNAMKDEEYFDQLLRTGLVRPSAAVVLSSADREKYRREHWGIDA